MLFASPMLTVWVAGCILTVLLSVILLKKWYS
jgi:hypothetical protein